MCAARPHDADLPTAPRVRWNQERVHCARSRALQIRQATPQISRRGACAPSPSRRRRVLHEGSGALEAAVATRRFRSALGARWPARAREGRPHATAIDWATEPSLGLCEVTTRTRCRPARCERGHGHATVHEQEKGVPSVRVCTFGSIYGVFALPCTWVVPRNWSRPARAACTG